MTTAPLVSVVLAVRDGEPYVRLAVESVLRQTVRDLELVVVDDASTDATPATLADVADPRLRVVRNDEQLGLAGSLNRGLDEARGAYVARMDADDAAFPTWLDACLRLLTSDAALAFAGTGVVDVDESGAPGPVHLLDAGRLATRWRAVFSAPVFHDTVVVDRSVLEANGLRYDTAYGESEDYELWTRLLDVADGDNVETPLVVHRLHPRQASERRAGLQRSLAEAISLRQIQQLAPDLGERGCRSRAGGVARAFAGRRRSGCSGHGVPRGRASVRAAPSVASGRVSGRPRIRGAFACAARPPRCDGLGARDRSRGDAARPAAPGPCHRTACPTPGARAPDPP